MNTKVQRNATPSYPTSQEPTSAVPVCREPVPVSPPKPAAKKEHSFAGADARKALAHKSVSGQGVTPKTPHVSAKSAYLQAKGTYFNGAQGKSGVQAELTGAQVKAKVGTKQTQLTGEAKALTGEAKSTINANKRSLSVGLGASAIEAGANFQHGNYGVGAKVAAGVGFSARGALCDDKNKDGKKEISIDISGGILGKLGFSLRFPNPLASTICPTK